MNSDLSSVPSPAAPPPAALPAKSPVKRVLLALSGAGLCLWLGSFLLHLWRYTETDDAYVTGHIHQVSAEIAGPVKAVLAQDNQVVRSGETLVQIDPLEFTLVAAKADAGAAQARAAEAQAQAAVAQAEAALPEAQARVAQAIAQSQQAEAEASLAQLTLTRDEGMAQGEDHAVTPADLDAARSADAAARARVRGAAANLAALRAAVVSAQALQTAARAQAQAARAGGAVAQAAVQDAQRRLGYTNIAAPADGRVGNRSVEVGDRVQAGQTLFVLVEPEVWIVANFKETQLARLRPGEPVEVSLDAVPERPFHGTIVSFAPASGGQFALLPADNATGNFTKVVQRVPVRIQLEPGSLDGIADRIRPGLSAVVAVRVR